MVVVKELGRLGMEVQQDRLNGAAASWYLFVYRKTQTDKRWSGGW